MKKIHIPVITACLICAVSLALHAQETKYKPAWESIDARETPQWYVDAKFGIFIHWGIYAVPAWAPEGQYSEWYWKRLEEDREKPGGGPTLDFHTRVYGKDFDYRNFAPLFRAQRCAPDEGPDFFARAGARYIGRTTKHHDGYCLWPSSESKGWNSVDIGPNRDLLGDLTEAVRARGLKMGYYYSLYEWFHPLYRKDVNRYVNEHMIPQFMDLVMRYSPSLIFSDGEWEYPSSTWKSPELLAWLFNDSPCRDEVVINDRWGKDERSIHGGYYTTEYGQWANKEMGPDHPWEENRGMGASFGYSRREPVDEYKSPGELIHLLVSLVSKGGNLLLDIGPTADGRIPVIMQERLVEIGDWLKINGEAIYGSRPWRVQSEGENVFYTQKSDAVYAVITDWPERMLVLESPRAGSASRVSLLGYSGNLPYYLLDGKMQIEVPMLSVDEVPCRHAYVFKLTGVR